MNPPRGVVIFAATLLVSIVVYATVSQLNPPSSTVSLSTATSSTAGISSYATSSPDANAPGLEIILSDNATDLTAGQRLQVNVTLANTSSEVDGVNASSEWAFQGIPTAMWRNACFFTEPVELALVEGNYTADTLPTIANSTFSYSCSQGGDVDSIVFAPDSDRAAVNLDACFLLCVQHLYYNYPLNLVFTSDGSWDLKNLSSQLDEPIVGPSGISPSPSEPFVAGTYTLAACDEWGQTVLLHFLVTG